jgi:hypothetical protein
LKELQDKSPDIKTGSVLSHKFRKMMENKQEYLLKKWVAEVGHAGSGAVSA